MGFKKTTRDLDFADLAMANCLLQVLPDGVGTTGGSHSSPLA
jgi:hypothetical protein